MENQLHDLIIIGSGPAALTAAIYAARAHLNPLIIEGDKPGGQLMGTSIVENWPGQISIFGPQLMIDMKEQAEKLGTKFISGSVVKVDFSTKPLQIWTDKKSTFTSKTVIIATGASPNRLNCPGETDYWGKGITSCAVCDGALYKNKPIVVVGGGDSAMESASFLLKFTNKITIVQNLPELSASYIMQQRVLQRPEITIIYNSTVTEFKGNGKQVTHAIIKNSKTGDLQTLPIDGVFINIGLTPNTKPFEGQITLEKGYIVVNNHTHTNIPGVFAAGDVHDYLYKQAITAAGDGCKAALDAERYLAAGKYE